MAFLASCSRSSAKGLGFAPGVGADCVCVEGCGLVVARCEAGAATWLIGVAGCGGVTGVAKAVGVTVEGVVRLFEIRATVSLASRKLPVTLKSWLTSWSDFGVGFFRI